MNTIHENIYHAVMANVENNNTVYLPLWATNFNRGVNAKVELENLKQLLIERYNLNSDDDDFEWDLLEYDNSIIASIEALSGFYIEGDDVDEVIENAYYNFC